MSVKTTFKAWCVYSYLVHALSPPPLTLKWWHRTGISWCGGGTVKMFIQISIYTMKINPQTCSDVRNHFSFLFPPATHLNAVAPGWDFLVRRRRRAVRRIRRCSCRNSSSLSSHPPSPSSRRILQYRESYETFLFKFLILVYYSVDC
jgi:hypothetical protein